MYDQNPLRLFQIPEEILTDDILARLPVKSLSRFKCVSKSCRSLIESGRFIKIQYRSSAKNPRLIMEKLSMQVVKVKGCSVQSLLNSKEGSDPTKKEAMSGRLVGCCNGMVCLYSYRDLRFRLWNPAIRVCIELPDNGCRYFSKYGFGWDESSGAYKVFAVLSAKKHSERRGRVYSSKTNSWRTLPHGSLSLFSPLGVFVSGNIHWIKWRHSHEHENEVHEIEFFDLGREEFGTMELPSTAPNDKCYRPWLVDIGGCLGILSDNKQRLDLWVMKEYGVKVSWSKLFSFPPTALSEHSMPTRFAPFFGEGPNGEDFMIYGRNLMIYSPKDNAFTTATNNTGFTRGYLYVKSLVSPKRILDATNTS